jgi:hypothetical protein
LTVESQRDGRRLRRAQGNIQAVLDSIRAGRGRGSGQVAPGASQATLGLLGTAGTAGLASARLAASQFELGSTVAGG